MLAVAALAALVTAIALAATADVPFWDGIPLAICAGSLSGLAVFVRRPTAIRAAVGLVVGFGVGLATYLGMVLATLSWWEA